MMASKAKYQTTIERHSTTTIGLVGNLILFFAKIISGRRWILRPNKLRDFCKLRLKKFCSKLNLANSI